MSEPIDPDSRSVLEYIPDIRYVEPDVVSEDPAQLFVDPDPIKMQPAIEKAKAVQLFAQNIEKIAEGAQEKADELAKGFEVVLKPKTEDVSAISAMRRQYPSENSKKITYDQYKKCKDHLRELANKISDKVLSGLSDENLEKEMNIISSGDVNLLLDMVGPGETNRPEEDPILEILEPLDLDEFQDLLLRYLVNILWKEFIKPILVVTVPGGSMLPDQVAGLPEGAPTPEEMMGKKLEIKKRE